MIPDIILKKIDYRTISFFKKLIQKFYFQHIDAQKKASISTDTCAYSYTEQHVMSWQVREIKKNTRKKSYQ
jgi:hypothetical protein